MSNLAAYHQMARNNAWANATFYKAAFDLDDQQHLAAAPGFFPTLCRTLNHIFEVDLYYLDALLEGGLDRAVYMRSDEYINDLTELATAQANVDQQLIQFCDQLTATTLHEQRRTERKLGDVCETVSALLLHLFQHQIHHRGQAHVQLHSLGVAPPQLDDFYLEFGRVPSAKVYWS